jgi:hypothetical protein
MTTCPYLNTEGNPELFKAAIALIEQLGLSHEMTYGLQTGEIKDAIAIRNVSRRFDSSGLAYWSNPGNGHEISFKEFTRLASEMASERKDFKDITINPGYFARVRQNGIIEIHGAAEMKFTIEHAEEIVAAHQKL